MPRDFFNDTIVLLLVISAPCVQWVTIKSTFVATEVGVDPNEIGNGSALRDGDPQPKVSREIPVVMPYLTVLILVEQGEGCYIRSRFETMGLRSIAGNRLSTIARAALLLGGLSTYLIYRDDVVWHFIKSAPHSRLLEHVLFGTASGILGFAFLLKMKISAHPESQDGRGSSRITATVASLLQAIGIGSLLPLPGFLLLVLGDLAVSLLLDDKHSTAEDLGTERDPRRAGRPLQISRWRNTLATHIGLCFAFLSMVIFSVVLVDRIADVLFAMTALASVAANSRSFLRG